MQPDLFSAAARYPALPGYKAGDTSAAAADSMTESAPILRERCLDRLRMGPASADEVAAWLGVSILAIRPRFSELHKAGAIIDTGDRRPNACGRSAKVWRCA